MEIIFDSGLKFHWGSFRIEIITGKGNHSKNNIAVLFPEVKKLLSSKGYKFKIENNCKFYCEVKE